MKARQFFDVWEECVTEIGIMFSNPIYSATSAESVVRMRVEARHGAKVAAEAAVHFRRIFDGAKTGGR